MLLTVEGGGFFFSSASGYIPDHTFFFWVKKTYESYALESVPVGRESSAPSRIGPTKQQDILPRTPVSTGENDQTHAISTVDDNIITNKVSIKSSLKKTTVTISSGVNNGNENLSKRDVNVCGLTKKRRVRWSDVYGGDLAEIWEFEASSDDDDNSDDEYEYQGGTRKTFACRIM
ncbi:hypothetical protein POM88_022254 [Heracleum sosnowskyi]|uniref:Uncharacterized protein n=1 Tax=Heracleum sosnowskyi TaxID=360622 RepID=A0AAD8IEX4_9APIA|nr:hypothetical protein POM88_022254 [Heracleum sosnowskyi]